MRSNILRNYKKLKSRQPIDKHDKAYAKYVLKVACREVVKFVGQGYFGPKIFFLGTFIKGSTPSNPTDFVPL